MWDRKTLKTYARQELSVSYWLSFAVCLVTVLLTGGIGGSGRATSSRGGTSPDASPLTYDSGTLAIMAAIFFTALLFILAYGIFVSNPLLVGKTSFFIRAPYGDRKFSHLFSSFKGGRYGSIVRTMLLTNLFIALWTLLLIVPGIVKAYQYRMVAYIISDDPSLTPKQAMDLSRRMTDGEKWRMFVLDLSFLGWVLLGLIALGIGIVFVMPYFEATYAQLYFAIRPKVTAPQQDPTPYGPAY